MSSRIEYPLYMFFQQLYWAWKNWNFRPDSEESYWSGLVEHYQNEIRKYKKAKAALKDSL